MTTKENLIVGASAVAGGGIPQEMQDGIVQLVIGLVSLFIVRLFDKIFKKKDNV